MHRKTYYHVFRLFLAAASAAPRCGVCRIRRRLGHSGTPSMHCSRSCPGDARETFECHDNNTTHKHTHASSPSRIRLNTAGGRYSSPAVHNNNNDNNTRVIAATAVRRFFFACINGWKRNNTLRQDRVTPVVPCVRVSLCVCRTRIFDSTANQRRR